MEEVEEEEGGDGHKEEPTIWPGEWGGAAGAAHLFMRSAQCLLTFSRTWSAPVPNDSSPQIEHRACARETGARSFRKRRGHIKTPGDAVNWVEPTLPAPGVFFHVFLFMRACPAAVCALFGVCSGGGDLAWLLRVHLCC